MATELERIKAQSFLDKMKEISDNFNKGSQIGAPNGKKTHIGKDGQVLGYWENSSKFVYTNGDDAKSDQYAKNVKDLGFTWMSGEYKALTPAEYLEKQKGMLFESKATLNNDPLSVNKNTSVMKTYMVNQDIYDDLGRFYIVENKNKTKLFKKGDKVQSNTIKDGGIFAKPTISNNFYKDFFIPLAYLTEVTGSTNEPTSQTSNELSVNNTKLLQYAVIGLILYVVFIK